MNRCPLHNIEITTGGCMKCSQMSVANNPTTLGGEVVTAELKFVSPVYHSQVVERLTNENEKLRAIVNAAMVMYAACPADPDATMKYEAAVDTFVDALASVGLRMPASLPADSSRTGKR